MDPREINSLAPRAATVRRIAESLGFALVGIAPAEPTNHEAELRRWIGEGKHGSMDYLARQVDTMADPRKLVPAARSVICLADRYGGRDEGNRARRHEGAEAQIDWDSALNTPVSNPQSAVHDPQSSLSTPNPKSEIPNPKSSSPLGRIASYAHGDDYHWVMKRRMHAMADELRVLWPEHEFRSCVDTAPLMEREHAARAGLGWIGKHTLLIHPQFGSWLYLGEIVTTLVIATSSESAFPAPLIPPDDHCGTCTRCIDACPTQCITPHSVDASRCVSYLTIEHRGEIDPTLHPMMGDWLAGCDVCQAVCPFNQGEGQGPRAKGQGKEDAPTFSGGAEGPRADSLAAANADVAPHAATTMNAQYQPRSCAVGSVHPEYAPRPPAPALPLLTVLNWTETSRQAALVRSALKRIKLDMWKRNALIAAGNRLTEHDDPSLRSRVESLSCDEGASEMVRATAKQVMARLANDSSRRKSAG